MHQRHRGQYAEPLESAGVDTVKELATRNAENLARAMADVNARKKRVRQVPAQSQVSRWIDEAKTLAPVITHCPPDGAASPRRARCQAREMGVS